MRSYPIVAFFSLIAFCASGAGLAIPDDVSKLRLECTEAISHADYSDISGVELWCPSALLPYIVRPDHPPIPPEWWPESVRRLRPIAVYTEGHGAVVIVQALTGIEERGIYVHLPISSQFLDLATRKPPWRYRDLGKGVYQYEREPKPNQALQLTRLRRAAPRFTLDDFHIQPAAIRALPSGR